jgi:hypothetical protein
MLSRLASFLSVACAVIFLTSPFAHADQLALGSTAELLDKQTNLSIRGVLVAPNELAPCGSSSKADDIHFAPPRYAVNASPRPCPGLPLVLSATVRQAYLSGNASLIDVYSTKLRNATFTPQPKSP